MDNRPVGLVPPHPNRRPHPCNGMTAEVHCGDGAYMKICDPTADPSVGWTLNWGDPEVVSITAASVLYSYAYLLSDHITTSEAIRRLRILRQARQELAAQHQGEEP